MRKGLFFMFLLVSSLVIYGQENWTHDPAAFHLNIAKTTGKVVLDGVLDEAAWQSAEVANNFWLKFPNNNRHADSDTKVRVCYDDNFLYVAAICYDSSQRYLSQSLKRDQGLRSGDGFAVVLDPFNQKTNGFFFVVSAFNAQTEDLISANSDSDIDFSWDNKWFSQTKITAEGWTVEIAIPFNILRFDPTRLKWGINFIRSDRKKNQFYTWTRVPLQFPGFNIGYLGEMQWPAAPPKSGTNVSINPYIAGGLQQPDNTTDADPKASFNAGFDAKVAVTPSLNLDLTVNPDFSQVDVDRQVTNLSRFNIFFPERRVFFLENSDLFSTYGIPPVRPFYSRRIGAKNGVNVPILFGARLSGNVTKKTRIGLMNIQTGKKSGEAADNFTAFSFSQQVLQRSSVNGYLFNRQGFLTEAQKQQNPLDAYGRNAGFELGFTNKEGNWNGWHGQHYSMKPGVKGKNMFINLGGEYTGRNFGFVLDVNTLGENFYADMGFENVIENQDDARDTTIRLGAKQIYNETRYTYVASKNSKLNQIRIGLENGFQYTPDGKPYERSHELSVRFSYKTTASIGLNIANNHSYLRFPFKFTDGAPLPAATYHYTQYGVDYNTDVRKDFSWQGGITLGRFYNANFYRFSTGVNVRRQPRYTFALTAEYNLLNFPQPYGREEIVLVAPSFEYNFSTKIFWTTFLQLNTQNNNININSRLQWRYRPMSDLFIVYTDNYFTDPLLRSKNRGLVCKLNYWINW
jgi:hypothetical protein